MTRRRVLSNSTFVHCPFCDYLVETTNPAAWCANCYCEYTVGWKWITFDDQLVNPKFAFAKALQKSGGASFGENLTAMEVEVKDD